MATRTEVAAPEPASVPALRPTPAMEIDSNDIALPRLAIAQFMSDAVQESRVKPGVLFTSLGKDDPEPVVVWDPEDKKASAGLTVHVLSMFKGKSLNVDGELVRWQFNDPDAPTEAWTTYNYAIALPELDPELPYKWLLTRSGRPAAQQMNMVIMKNATRGPAHELAFNVTTALRSSPKGKWFVPMVAHVEAKAENVQVADNLAALVAQRGQDFDPPSTGDEPAI